MARTPKTTEDRREDILNAAIQVFGDHGFTRATNKDIAREAGISPGLIYHYFESKAALLDAILQERSPLRVIRALPAEALDQPPERFLRMLLRQVIQTVETDQFLRVIRVFLSEVTHNPELAPAGSTLLKAGIGFLASYLGRQMERGTLRRGDPELIAQTMMGALIGFELRRHILHDADALRYSTDEIVETIVTTTLEGLLPR